jgi:DNA-binding NtrC family response regulator
MNQVRNSLEEVDDLASRCPALLGTSAAMRRARSAVRVAARTTVAVLVKCEEGCLGEMVARTIHDAGSQSKAPFVRVECGGDDAAALVSRLVEEPGRTHDVADGLLDGSRATVFLDRVDRLAPSGQAKLAEGFGLGQLGAAGSKIRILAGTHEDLSARVSTGTFRQDLYYHLAVLIVEIPPLRMRQADISVLFSHFLRQIAASSGRPVPRVSRRVIELCEHYGWTGNLRELRCVVERLMISSTASRLSPRSLPDEIRRPTAPNDEAGPVRLPPEGMTREELERQLIRQALDRNGGNRTHAARMLGLSRQTLLYRMKKYGLR